MMEKNSLEPKEWLSVARKDWERIRRNLEKFKDLCRRVSSYYVLERYPPFGIDLTKEELEKDINETQQLIKSLFSEEELP